MTPLPKKKHTRSRTGKRRGAKRLSSLNLTACPSCKKLKKPHIACPHCGWHHRKMPQK